MAEKKFGFGSVLAIGAVAAVAAGAVVSYLKREELKILAEEVTARLKKDDAEAEVECCCEEECAGEEDVDIVIEACEEAAEEACDEGEELVIEISVEKAEEAEA